MFLARALRAAVVTLALTGCVTDAMRNADTMTPAGVLSGSVMDRATCESQRTAWHGSDTVWVVLDPDWDPEDGTCIRYVHAGLTPVNPTVFVFFHGDVMQQAEDGWARAWPGYETITPQKLRSFAKRESENAGLPYIRVSRPGTYGSSGFHKQRRRAEEGRILNAALDLIKERHRIDAFALVGQSGGGHVVAALLTMRDDIVCAVATSGVLSVTLRRRHYGWATDITGYRDYFDPLENADAIVDDPDRRLFVVGDPRDRNTPFFTQRAYAQAVEAAGHDVALIRAEAGGKAHHSLALTGFKVMRWCVDGLSAEEIQSRLPIPPTE